MISFSNLVFKGACLCIACLCMSGEDIVDQRDKGFVPEVKPGSPLAPVSVASELVCAPAREQTSVGVAVWLCE